MDSKKVFESSNNKEKVSFRNVMRVAGAVIAFLIGSGFASGQEVFQFLTVYGYRGLIGSLIAMFICCCVSGILMSFGYRTRNKENSSPYSHYLGKYFGQFMTYYTPFFAFLITIVMISGTGATLNQYFGLDPKIGTIAMTILITIIALLGLTRVVDVISLIGPFLIVFTLSIAFYTLATNPGNFSSADQALKNMNNLPYGAGNSRSYWVLASILFVAYNIVAGVPFMVELGSKEVTSNKEAWIGGIAGGVGLMSAAFALNLAMLGHVDELVGAEVPVITLAQKMGPWVSFIFVIILLAGIFSTSVPMLLTVTNSLSKEDTKKSTKNILIVLVAFLALVGGQLPFGRLVGLVYPFTGYFGIAMIVLFIVKEFKERKEENL
ncbi:YkvI family membrane protein [Anaerococcus cruorum]|uniref:YkvI family membrane protein n=1 Tax=Anaerococcus sp. WGS1529 TaxID=3366812 RepID=UPI00372D327E